jgi:glycosyltransferase involved in cell wall biosynthesis
LQVNLDSPLPAALSVGAGTALFVCGTCFDRERKIRSLHAVVDGSEQPLAAFGMPRLDYFRALHPGVDPFAAGATDPASEEDPALHSYRSGFWGVVAVEPRKGAPSCELALRVRMAGGGEETVALAEIPLVELAAPVPLQTPPDGHGPLVAVCMATHDPPEDLLRRQLDSIRSQSHERWVCVISDDGSRADRFEALREMVAGDPRFVLSRWPARQGFYRNFERALAMAPAEAQYVALSDQDDYWYPEKLAVLLARIGEAQLVYSDARVIGRGGEAIASSYWERRRNNHSDLESLLVANSVTGAASLFRRELLNDALPFPPAQFAHYHDHWLGLVALATGGIEYVDQPLYDYVQHGHAALGHAAANRITALRERLGRVRSDPRERVRVNRVRYFVDLERLMAFATVLKLRAAAKMSAKQRRALERFLRVDRSWLAMARLGARAARELAGTPETLGAEWSLFQALAWRRLLSLSVRDRPTRRLRLDALPPPDLAPRAGRPVAAPGLAREVAEKIAPIELAASDDAPRRLNILIPTIELAHLFGGYIAKFNLAARLAERGARVRIVTVDPVGPLPRSWRLTVESSTGRPGLLDRVEVAFGRAAGPLEVSRADAFIATTWWTAHIAHAALDQLGREGFAYLIQEYEPFTFPMGSYAALAAQSYELPHFALFSTELLRDYFRRHGLGVYSGGTEAGDGASAAFENAISAVAPASESELRGRTTRRLLFYARPEPHAARNMFELGVLALQAALEEGLFRGGWELRGIGTVGGRRRVGLAEGAELELLPRVAPDEYADLLRGHDLGLALMYTPHPSLVPIEMAAAGMCTVTNTFENKTAEALAAISSNLIAGAPTVSGIASALRRAADRVGDYERRLAATRVAWSRDWQTSFDDRLLERLEEFLAQP